MRLTACPVGKTSAGAAQLPKKEAYQQNQLYAEPVFSATHNDWCPPVFPVKKYTWFPLRELRELPRIHSAPFNNLLLSLYFLKFQQFLLGTSCNKLFSFCMGLQSTISLSEKKRLQDLFQKQNIILLGLQSFKQYHMDYQLWRRECKKTEELWLRQIHQENHQAMQTFPDQAYERSTKQQNRVNCKLATISDGGKFFVCRQPHSYSLALNLFQAPEQKPTRGLLKQWENKYERKCGSLKSQIILCWWTTLFPIGKCREEEMAFQIWKAIRCAFWHRMLNLDNR